MEKKEEEKVDAQFVVTPLMFCIISWVFQNIVIAILNAIAALGLESIWKKKQK
jgi:hypothetical protein